MKRRELLKKTGTGALALGVAGAASTARADDGKTFNWKLVMSWPKKFPGLATSMEWFVEEVKKATDGRLNITIYGAGELVPAFEVFNAVSDGTAEMGHGTPYYWKGKIPEAELFTSVPFGMTTDEFNAWFIHGEGQTFLTELYKPFGVVPLIGGNTMPQMGGWFNKEINSVEDLKGLKIRTPGIGGEVYRLAGATPVSLPGAEIFTSMQSGVLDATDWVGPWNDQAFGLYKAAKYYYSGWQEPNAMMEILINEKALATLPADIRAIVECLALAMNQKCMVDMQKNNAVALKKMLDSEGVQLRDFPADVIQVFKEKTVEYLKEYAAKSDTAKKILASYEAFLADQMRISANVETYLTYCHEK